MKTVAGYWYALFYDFVACNVSKRFCSVLILYWLLSGFPSFWCDVLLIFIQCCSQFTFIHSEPWRTCYGDLETWNPLSNDEWSSKPRPRNWRVAEQPDYQKHPRIEPEFYFRMMAVYAELFILESIGSLGVPIRRNQVIKLLYMKAALNWIRFLDKISVLTVSHIHVTQRKTIAHRQSI